MIRGVASGKKEQHNPKELLEVQPNSKEWWEARYAETEWLYGKQPSQFVVDNVEQIKPGKVLDLAMGEGRNAVYLASKGYEVDGVDFSDTALKRAEKLAAESGVSIKAQNKDIDMFLLPLMTYEAVVITDYKPSLRFFKDINRGLKQGGLILLDAFTVEQLRRGQGPKPEMFECFQPNEVLHHLKNVHVIFYQERPLENGQIRVQCLARKTTLVG